MKPINASKKMISEIQEVFDRHVDELGLREGIVLMSMGYTSKNNKFTIIQSVFTEKKRFSEE